MNTGGQRNVGRVTEHREMYIQLFSSINYAGAPVFRMSKDLCKKVPMSLGPT